MDGGGEEEEGGRGRWRGGGGNHLSGEQGRAEEGGWVEVVRTTLRSQADEAEEAKLS